MKTVFVNWYLALRAFLSSKTGTTRTVPVLTERASDYEMNQHRARTVVAYSLDDFDDVEVVKPKKTSSAELVESYGGVFVPNDDDLWAPTRFVARGE